MQAAPKAQLNNLYQQQTNEFQFLVPKKPRWPSVLKQLPLALRSIYEHQVDFRGSKLDLQLPFPLFASCTPKRRTSSSVLTLMTPRDYTPSERQFLVDNSPLAFAIQHCKYQTFRHHSQAAVWRLRWYANKSRTGIDQRIEEDVQLTSKLTLPEYRCSATTSHLNHCYQTLFTSSSSNIYRKITQTLNPDHQSSRC